MQNPAQFKIPAWFLNRQRDMTDGKDAHVVSNGIDQVRQRGRCRSQTSRMLELTGLFPSPTYPFRHRLRYCPRHRLRHRLRHLPFLHHLPYRLRCCFCHPRKCVRTWRGSRKCILENPLYLALA